MARALTTVVLAGAVGMTLATTALVVALVDTLGAAVVTTTADEGAGVPDVAAMLGDRLPHKMTVQ